MSDTSTKPADRDDEPTFGAAVAAETLQATLDSVRALFDECHLRVDEGGVHLSAIDPATVAWIDLELSRGAFEEFEATPAHLGVDLERLGDVAGMAASGQSVRLALDPETRRLRIRIGELEYDLALLDPDVLRSPPEGAVEEFEFTGRAVADGADFERAVRAAAMVADHAALGIDEDDGVFSVAAEGDTDDVSLELTAEDLFALDPGEARSLFSLDYLEPIARATSGDANPELRLGVEQPLSIRYAFADGDGSVEYLLAPRIAAN